MAPKPLDTKLIEPRLTVGERTMIKILDGAIKCYGRSGFDGASFEQIAKAAGVSRPLLTHYFKDKEDLFAMAAKRIRLQFQQMAIDAIQAAGDSPEGMLRGYVGSIFDWVELHPVHVRVWMLHYYECATQAKMKALNSDLVNTGHDRIAALLERGAKAGAFAKGHYLDRAKVIQILVTGVVVSAITEDVRIPLKRQREIITKQCLAIAKSGA